MKQLKSIIITICYNDALNNTINTSNVLKNLWYWNWDVRTFEVINPISKFFRGRIEE